MWAPGSWARTWACSGARRFLPPLSPHKPTPRPTTHGALKETQPQQPGATRNAGVSTPGMRGSVWVCVGAATQCRSLVTSCADVCCTCAPTTTPADAHNTRAWRRSHPSHRRLRALGLTPVTRDAAPAGTRRYPYVLFAAPPSGSADYPAAVSVTHTSQGREGLWQRASWGCCGANSLEAEQLLAAWGSAARGQHTTRWLTPPSSPPSRAPPTSIHHHHPAPCLRLQVAAAVQQWDGSGSFVFTSSMSVCATEDGSAVNENCPLVEQGKSPSTDRCVHGTCV